MRATVVDEYRDGIGAIDARLWGVIPLVHPAHDPRLDEGALLRYLAEAASGASISFRLTGDHRRAAMFRGGSGATAPSGILVTHTAHDPALEKRLAEAGCPVAYHTDDHYMWRVISPAKLARRFGVALERAAAIANEMFADPHSLYWTSDRF
jgi:hypothetical protein